MARFAEYFIGNMVIVDHNSLWADKQTVILHNSNMNETDSSKKGQGENSRHRMHTNSYLPPYNYRIISRYVGILYLEIFPCPPHYSYVVVVEHEHVPRIQDPSHTEYGVAQFKKFAWLYFCSEIWKTSVRDMK